MSRIVVGWIAALVVSSLPARAAEPPGFAGDWKTTLGPMSLKQDGDAFTGVLDFFKIPLKGKLKDGELTLEYDEQDVHVRSTSKLDPTGLAFQGKTTASNGFRNVWNGWRPEPASDQGGPADFSGLWLTDLGLMELTQTGSDVKGRYALRGTSSLEGKVRGRRLDFRIKAFREGPGWFDLDPSGKTLRGAGGTDGNAPWYAWKGRRAPEFSRHAPPVAGKIVDGSTDGLLTYSVRAPDAYKADDARRWPTIVILHGSNMNGRAYVNTIAARWPDIARDYLIIGINGETPSSIEPDKLVFNYTYVNFVGRSTFKGFPGTDRESPALVLEALADLRRAYPIDRYFVGGHSQGGFLTYSLLMNGPESIAGAFPISAGLIFQCEPSAYADPDLKAAQRRVPLAIVHGKTDPLVPFGSGEYASNLFLDEAWPALRFFSDAEGAHAFANLPVGPAIRWLEAISSDDPKVLLDFASKRLDESSPRDAISALRRAESLRLEGEPRQRFVALKAKVRDLCQADIRKYSDALRSGKDHAWIDDFLTFRESFAHADVASELLAIFDGLRADQNEPASKLLNEARNLFRQNHRDDAFAKLRQITETYYASTSYRQAKQWLAEAK
ncbi:hypothetical protein [Singulisphaera sp. PoT]|uniref:hypothetical protein n=1 Tax=Singulisphaera sp. PoT TaxID=3411797 RepID=UPI003BF52EFC